MNLLTPLGLLGLLGLVALIIIYIIKPNFQNKIISSTFVWKRSLKYKKKKIPISKLRNLLLLICQILIITAAAFILAQPYLDNDDEIAGDESVIIIDASASMMSESAGITRFERAVLDVEKYVDELFENEKRVSIIIASDESYFLVQNASAESAVAVKTALNSLLDVSDSPCTFGTPDIDGAITLSEEITSVTLNAEVKLYTDTTYIDDGKVDVVNVTDPAEWNAAILDVRASLFENKYYFEVDVACYGMDTDIRVYCDFYGVNIEESTLNYEITARCSGDEVQTLLFSFDEEAADEVIDIYEYDYVHVYLKEYDSLSYDNNYYRYGGRRPVLKVQYYSYYPNNYFATALMVLRNQLADDWDIEIDQISSIDEMNFGILPETEGYDLYIYEHIMPSTIPSDGIVILANPNQLPSSTGLQLGRTYSAKNGINLEAGDSHPIMQNIKPENITVSLFTEISNYDDYVPLMQVEGKPVVMAKNEPDQKIVVMTFSHNYSNFAMMPDFPLFMYNIIDYYSPSTLSGFVFDVNDEIELNARGESINVAGPGVDVQLDTFPSTLPLKQTGVYTATQDLISGETEVESFFVKLPDEESNINQKIDTLKNPYFFQETEITYDDLLIYFASALVALLFIEWWLKSREQA